MTLVKKKKKSKSKSHISLRHYSNTFFLIEFLILKDSL